MDNESLKVRVTVIEIDQYKLEVIKDGLVLGSDSLTNNRNLDTILLDSLDKIIRSNRIDRLDVKSLEVVDDSPDASLSGSILKALSSALKY